MWKIIENIYSKIEKILGGMKFGISIILIFVFCLIIGTFVESRFGTDFAGRLIYKSVPFMLIQGLMFLSIFFATLRRLPFRINFLGFYTLHLGLLLVFVGSFVTYVAGIDGSISLKPNEPNRQFSLNQDQLVLYDMQGNLLLQYDLPYQLKSELNSELGPIKILSYLSFAEKKISFLPATPTNKSQPNLNTLGQTVEILLDNKRFKEKVLLSEYSVGDLTSSRTLGPLSIHLFHQNMDSCFSNSDPVFLWNLNSSTCLNLTKSALNLYVKSMNQFMMELDGEKYDFYPSKSAMPYKGDSPDENSPWRIFNKQIFEDQINLFIMGSNLHYFDKNNSKKWVHFSIKVGEELKLPWMDFVLTPLLMTQDMPQFNYDFFWPKSDLSGELNTGVKALQVQVGDSDKFWVTSEGFTPIGKNEQSFYMQIQPKQLVLPFSLTLDEFKMDKNPGTDSPASFESFVRVFHSESNSDEKSKPKHLFMNNPLKEAGFTFYQSSYFEITQDFFGSVLSINHDPGRFLKYLGSLLLVLGSIYHFLLRNKKIEFSLFQRLKSGSQNVV